MTDWPAGICHFTTLTAKALRSKAKCWTGKKKGFIRVSALSEPNCHWMKMTDSEKYADHRVTVFLFAWFGCLQIFHQSGSEWSSGIWIINPNWTINTLFSQVVPASKNVKGRWKAACGQTGLVRDWRCKYSVQREENWRSEISGGARNLLLEVTW